MKPHNKGFPAMKLLKLRIATGLGLLILMATMIGGPVRVSQAQDDEGVTLADLAGNSAGRGSGFFTRCFNAGFTAPEDCATAPNQVPFNQTGIFHRTGDAAGNFCGVITVTIAPVSGTKFPAGVSASTTVGTTSFDPTTGSGTQSFSRYHGGTCSGAVFDMTGATLLGTPPAASSFPIRVIALRALSRALVRLPAPSPWRAACRATCLVPLP
jgi:hypothetical protein